MKKVILGTTFIASLLLAGGVNAFAVTDIPDPMTIPIELEYANNATFEFNEISLTKPEITKEIFDQPVHGTITVGNTLTNPTAYVATVNINVTAPNELAGIEFPNDTFPITADSVAKRTEQTNIDFTVNDVAAQNFAQNFASLPDEDKPVFTITAQEGNSDNGDNLSL
ncbi:hypothetical protein ACR76W_12680 [Enterococcus casseliflavus]|uniref:hypothetical protein n=1 Tax=Enterococcus casseliflavus TaxID=37734 RepID=UPI003DA2612C